MRAGVVFDLFLLVYLATILLFALGAFLVVAASVAASTCLAGVGISGMCRKVFGLMSSGSRQMFEAVPAGLDALLEDWLPMWGEERHPYPTTACSSCCMPG